MAPAPACTVGQAFRNVEESDLMSAQNPAQPAQPAPAARPVPIPTATDDEGADETTPLLR
jgi:hypothetical protein